jgi:predicted TIM-barrel fold metal-dependent hydrolase
MALSGPSELEDLGIDRLKHMDAMGIDVQVLSYTTPGTQVLSASEAVPLARDANDQVASAVVAHPDRFAGFATLPTSDPEAAAAELERAVHELGFKGAMINGRTQDHFLDDPRFNPVLKTAEALDVSLYLHPTLRPKRCRMPTILALTLSRVGALPLSGGDGTWRRASTRCA